MCSRPSTSIPRRSGSTDPHHARANSNTPIASERKCSRSSASRAVTSSPGKHSSRLRRAMRRRSPSSARSSAPSGVPSARCHDHGSRASSAIRSEEHTSELQSLMRISYAVFCLKKKQQNKKHKQLNRQNTQQTLQQKHKT